jgi:hypothetical protein
VLVAACDRFEQYLIRGDTDRAVLLAAAGPADFADRARSCPTCNRSAAPVFVPSC